MKIKELTAKDVKNITIDKAPTIVLIFIIIGTTIIEPLFLQMRVPADMLTQSAVKMICALGLISVLLLGGIDLSSGHQVGLVAVVVASLSQMADYSNKFWPDLPELSVIIPVTMTLALVAVMGAVNGSMTAKLEMAPFITTFGMSTIIYNINCLYSAEKPNNSQSTGGIRNDLTVFNSSRIFGQISFLMVTIVTAIIGVWSLPNKIMFGKNIYIMGGNPEAAKVSGINVSKMIITIFATKSMFVGLTGILEVARIGGANSTYGDAYEFDAISSCAVGGVSLSGGVGKISGAITGVLIFAFISYGFAYIGVNPNWQLIIKGLIICNAVALDMRKNP